jgi:phosphotriesterase-related protein
LHKALLAKGVYIGFDRIAHGHVDDTVKSVAELCKLGHAKQITLSHDYIAYYLGKQSPFAKDYVNPKEWRSDLISKKFIPALKAQGVTDEQIKMITVENPKNLFWGR